MQEVSNYNSIRSKHTLHQGPRPRASPPPYGNKLVLHFHSPTYQKESVHAPKSETPQPTASLHYVARGKNTTADHIEQRVAGSLGVVTGC